MGKEINMNTEARKWIHFNRMEGGGKFNTVITAFFGRRLLLDFLEYVDKTYEIADIGRMIRKKDTEEYVMLEAPFYMGDIRNTIEFVLWGINDELIGTLSKRLEIAKEGLCMSVRDTVKELKKLRQLERMWKEMKNKDINLH